LFFLAATLVAGCHANNASSSGATPESNDDDNDDDVDDDDDNNDDDDNDDDFSSDVFAVGFAAVGAVDDDTYDGVVLHYNGTSWSTAWRAPGAQLAGVWGTSPSDVFAVGAEMRDWGPAGPVIQHYDGMAWTDMPLPADAILVGGVWGSSPSDVFAVGGAWTEDGLTPIVAQILHYDGTSWNEMPEPSEVVSSRKLAAPFNNRSAIGPVGAGDDDAFDVEPLPWVDEYIYYSGVWGSSPTDVFAVGLGINYALETSGFVVHYDGASWTTIPDVFGGLAGVWVRRPLTYSPWARPQFCITMEPLGRR